MSTRIQGSSNNGSYLYVDYTVASANVVGNYTDVTWSVGVHWGSYYFNIHNAIVNMSTTVTGASVGLTTSTGTYNSGWPISGAGTNRDHVFRTGTTRVYHNSSGVGNIRFAGSAFWDTPVNFTSSLAQTVALPSISRTSSAPSKPVLSSVTSTSMYVTFTDGTGGATIDSRQIAYNTTNSTSGASIVASDGSTAISGLTPGVTYYVWARTHNSAGYSSWSPAASATTLRTPTPPSSPTISSITQTSLVVSWTAPNNGGSSIIGYQLGYGTDPSAPTMTISASSPKLLSGLTPGTRYYFWVRAQNSVGYSAWSTVTPASTIAGVKIKVGAVWKLAVPYVKDAGVWKLARPWAKNAGTWKETI